MIRILQAALTDTDLIMEFIHKVWRKDHILSRHKELFLYEFQNKDMLNLIIAKDDDKIVGLFGFIYYNFSINPDIAGSLWKVDPVVKEPLLGIKMRDYFQQHIQHDFFAAPGAGIQTKNIYKVIGMNWYEMKHYYIANDRLKIFKIAKNPLLNYKAPFIDDAVQIKKVASVNDVKEFDFRHGGDIVPYKDFYYLKKRFFEHPIYRYDVFSLVRNNKIENIFICRKEAVLGSSVYRVVDFYGEEYNFNEIGFFLYNFIIDNSMEYVDFISYGFSHDLLAKAGFNLLDMHNDQIIIPNYFGPFVRKNISVYCVSDKTSKKFRQCKADGDQDRPSL